MKKIILAITLFTSFLTFADTDSASLIAKAKEVNPDKKIILVRSSKGLECSNGACVKANPTYSAKAKDVNPDKKIILVRSSNAQECLNGICVGDVVYSENTNQYGANVVALNHNDGTILFSNRNVDDENL